MPDCLNAALKYASRGWPVFPLWGSDGKKPITTHGVDDATTDPDIITEWWERWPDANVGIACGAKSFDVVDIDSQKGEAALISWLNERGLFDEGKAALNSTVINLTAKGKHLCFQPAGKLRNLVRAAEDIDIKTDGGYIVAPPSLHRETGITYTWAPEHGPDEIDLAPFPEWLIEYLKTGSNGSKRSLFSDEVIKIKEGERNQVLFKQGASARARGQGRAAIEAALLALNSTQCNPPLPEHEVLRIVESVLEYAPGGARDAIKESDEELPPPPPEDIKELASLILREGKPLDLVLDSCERFVLGAKDAIKKLVCCQMVQMVPSSRGLHPKLSGESGTGKTWCVKVFLHHLPEDAYIAGGLTPKALAYHDLGNRLFILLDDYVPNEDLDTIIKQTSSNFHKPYIHRTVKKQEAATLKIGSEMTWCVTSVDASQDIQVLNRQIPLNTDDSQDLTAKVNGFTISSYGEGLGELYVDDTVILCREIFRQLRELEEIKVRIPFADRIEWLDNTNRRNPSIFMDLLVGVTALHCFQRDQDEEGFYLATEEDFKCARELFSEGVDVEEMINRLTKKERQFAEMLIAYPLGLTRKELSEKLGVSPARISQIARGTKGDGGLMQKLPGFDLVNVTNRITEDQTESIQVYRLGCFDRLAGFDDVVRLSKEPVREKANSKIGKGSSSIGNSKYSKYIMTKKPLLGDGKILSITHSPEKANSPNSASGNRLTDDLPAQNEPNSLTQLLATYARKGEPIRTRDYPDIDELEMLEALDAGGWTEKRGVWWPPSEEKR